MAQVFTGAKARVVVNNITVGFVGGMNVNQEDTLTDVDVVGQLDVGDLAETAHKITFSINYFKAIASDASGGAAAQGGNQSNSAIALGFDSADLSAKRNRAYFDILIMDMNNNEIYKIENAKMESGSGTVDARGVWQGTWNFKARRGYGL